jgi:NitT/TauT family transport system substrate-binding protein
VIGGLRSVWVVNAALMWLAAAAHVSAYADVVRVGKAVPGAFSFTPLDVGIKTGAFKKYGIDIQSYSFSGSAKLQQAMAAGSLDIGLGSGPELALVAKGVPDKAVAAMADAPLLLALIVKKDGRINTIADLKGRRVGVSTVGSLTSWMAMQLARAQGWGANGLEVTPLGESKSQIIALSRGDVDGLITDLTTSLSEERAGRVRILFRFGDLVKDFHLHLIYASDDFIAKHPDELRAFLRGWFETIDYMHAHKAQTVDIAKDVMGVDTDIAARSYDELMPEFNTTGRFNPRALQTLATSFVDLKLLPTAPDLSKLCTEAYLPAR